MQKAIGPPVRGDSFFDRKQDLAAIWDQLETESVLLLAPRRVGKTSLMFRLQDTAKQHNFHAAYCNVEGARSEAEFLNEILKALQNADPDERDRKLRYLLDVLVADGYIALSASRFRFRSPLLRDFWNRRVKS